MNKGSRLTDGGDYRDCHKDIDKVQNYEYNIYAENTLGSYMWGMEKAVLEKEVGLIAVKQIRHLDFACGTGRIISFMEPMVSESTGIDISQNMLEIAKTKVKKAKLIQCDLMANDVISNSNYELITSFRFFLNAQDSLRKEIMGLLSGKLSEDGRLIFNVHGNTFSYYLLLVIMDKLGLKKEKVNHMSYLNVLQLIGDSDLVLKKSYGIGFIPYAFHRWLKPCKKSLAQIDNAVLNNRFLKYFASNMVFVCARKQV